MKVAAEGSATRATRLAAPAMAAAAMKASLTALVPAAPAVPAAIAPRAAMPIEPPISWPAVFSPESIPVSASWAPVMIDTETVTRTVPRPSPATSRPGSTSPR